MNFSVNSSSSNSSLSKTLKSNTGRIQHPHAHYNRLDELKCLICGTRIKNDALWQTHIASKAHQLNLRSQSSNQKAPLLRDIPATTPQPTSVFKKRPAPSITTGTPSKMYI